MEFEEKQSLKLWWIYILLAINAVAITSIIIFDKGGMNFQDLRKMYFLPFLAIALPFVIIFLIQKNKLTLHITVDGINYKYFPFNSRNTIFHWINIDKVYINKYDALGDYGGWGIRYRLWFKFRDKAFLLNDKSRGLQIEFKNGKRLLFSSNKVDELELFLINLKTRYNIQAIQ
jgi:hypothetical protein